MKSIRTVGILICLAFSAFSLAHVPCPGVEQHISYGGPYCADTSPGAYALASIQLGILRIQNPDDTIYFRTLFSGEINGQWCIYVEFVRCTKGKDPELQISKRPNVVNKYASYLEEVGFIIEDIQVLKNGLIDMELVNEDGLKFFLTFDKIGNLVQMMEVK